MEKEAPYRHVSMSLEETKKHAISVDNSPEAENAFKWADNNIVKNAEFVVIHGQYEAWEMPVPFTPLIPDATQEEEGAVIMKKFQNMCQASGRKCDFVNVGYRSMNQLCKRIVDAANTWHSSSVIVGSRNRSLGSRALHGSVSRLLVNLSNLPTTIVKHESSKK